MAEQIYIHEIKSDWSGPEEKVLEEAYYGPFLDLEDAVKHMNDAYADMLESAGAEVSVVGAEPSELESVYVNPREFWMSQLATLSDIQEIKNA